MLSRTQVLVKKRVKGQQGQQIGNFSITPGPGSSGSLSAQW